MPISVALGTHFESFVKEQLAAGRFDNASEVIRAGLRLLEDQEHLQALPRQRLFKAPTAYVAVRSWARALAAVAMVGL